MSKDKWMTDLSIEELKAKIVPKPHKPFEIDGMPVFLNTGKELLPQEIFKPHPELSSVEVSNLGRIRHDGKVLWQVGDIENPSPYGYLLVKIQEKSHRVYTLVAETWCERGDPVIYNTVHHISNNGMDNRADNLVWVTTEQHSEIHPFLKNLRK